MVKKQLYDQLHTYNIRRSIKQRKTKDHKHRHDSISEPCLMTELPVPTMVAKQGLSLLIIK